MQFERTLRAFKRWDRKNLYLEGEVIRRGNQTIRSLLLTKGHLIPPDLMPHACSLVEHYDLWLEEFERVRGDKTLSNATDFIWVGPKGYPFPTEAEERFKSKFKELQHELYDV